MGPLSWRQTRVLSLVVVVLETLKLAALGSSGAALGQGFREVLFCIKHHQQLPLTHEKEVRGN